MPSQVRTTEAELHALLERMGKRLRTVRASRGLTQEVFGGRAQLDAKHYQQIESGVANITLRTLLRLSAASDLSIEELLRK